MPASSTGAIRIPRCDARCRDLRAGGRIGKRHDGAGLTFLDVGATVSPFAVWAALRWPGSMINSFEPNPGTFGCPKRNTTANPAVHSNNAAVFPTREKKATFHSRSDRDGEAGRAACYCDTFREGTQRDSFEVDVNSPVTLPKRGIVKKDYRPNPKGDAYGHMLYERNGQNVSAA